MDSPFTGNPAIRKVMTRPPRPKRTVLLRSSMARAMRHLTCSDRRARHQAALGRRLSR